MDKTAAPIHARTKKRTQYGPITQWFGRTMLRLAGWKIVGKHPDVQKCIVSCAPHTSNWDFVFTLLVGMALSMPCVFMIKDNAFWWPMGALLRWLGGIPINRRAPEGTVDQMIQIIKESERIYVIITPSGTRKNVEYWKLGFYRIADGAGIPIAFGIINYEEKWAGIADLFHTTGDLEKDWVTITKVYQEKIGVTPKYRTHDDRNKMDTPSSGPAT